MKQVQYGMVGGDLKALIGEVHRKGLAFDPRAELVCGCFSAIDELNVECADYYNVDKSRIYFDYKNGELRKCHLYSIQELIDLGKNYR